MILGYMISAAVDGGISFILLILYSIQIYWHRGSASASAAPATAQPNNNALAAPPAVAAAAGARNGADGVDAGDPDRGVNRSSTDISLRNTPVTRIRSLFRWLGWFGCICQIVLVLDHEGGNGLFPLAFDYIYAPCIGAIGITIMGIFDVTSITILHGQVFRRKPLPTFHIAAIKWSVISTYFTLPAGPAISYWQNEKRWYPITSISSIAAAWVLCGSGWSVYFKLRRFLDKTTLSRAVARERNAAANASNEQTIAIGVQPNGGGGGGGGGGSGGDDSTAAAMMGGGGLTPINLNKVGPAAEQSGTPTAASGTSAGLTPAPIETRSIARNMRQLFLVLMIESIAIGIITIPSAVIAYDSFTHPYDPVEGRGERPTAFQPAKGLGPMALLGGWILILWYTWLPAPAANGNNASGDDVTARPPLVPPAAGGRPAGGGAQPLQPVGPFAGVEVQAVGAGGGGGGGGGGMGPPIALDDPSNAGQTLADEDASRAPASQISATRPYGGRESMATSVGGAGAGDAVSINAVTQSLSLPGMTIENSRSAPKDGVPVPPVLAPPLAAPQLTPPALIPPAASGLLSPPIGVTFLAPPPALTSPPPSLPPL